MTSTCDPPTRLRTTGWVETQQAARHYLRPDGTVDAEERQRTLAARGAQIPLGATGRPAGR